MKDPKASLSFATRVRRHKPLRFMVVGAVNTAFSYGLYSLFVFLGLSVAMASLASLILGILFSFATQGTLVFRNASRSTFFKFVIAWSVIYFVNLAIIEVLLRLGQNAYQAGALATLPVIAISYLVLNFLVFRQRTAPPATPQQF